MPLAAVVPDSADSHSSAPEQYRFRLFRIPLRDPYELAVTTDVTTVEL